MINTRRVANRRALRFQTVDDILADAEDLAARPHRSLGNWTLGQSCAHLSYFMDDCIDGFAFRVPVVVRLVGPLFKGRFLQKGFPAGVRLRGEAADRLIPLPSSSELGLAELRRAVARLKEEPARQPSPILGPLTREEWDQFHCRHAEHHLSFIIPN